MTMKEMSQLFCYGGGILCMVAGGALIYDTVEKSWMLFQEGLFWFGIGVFMVGFTLRGGGNKATV